MKLLYQIVYNDLNFLRLIGPGTLTTAKVIVAFLHLNYAHMKKLVWIFQLLQPRAYHSHLNDPDMTYVIDTA